ncbi:MAG: amidohydrolase [Clostridia bacterium]|nr:amidohydrolase [Clostridia bacterium]
MKTLFYGGNIITMAEPLYAEAVIVENERIIAVGREAELRQNADEFVNLNGATLMPGFIDAHSHLTEYATTLTQVPLGGIDNFEDMKNAIQKHIRDNGIPDGEWVIGRNYDHALFPNHKHPTKEQIDSIAPNHVLMIKHSSGHTGLVNECLIKKFNLTPETPVPSGGKIVTENGKLTGELEESALSMIRGKVPPIDIDKACEAHKKIQRLYASNGITTAQDGYLNSRMTAIYTKLHERGDLKLDIISYAPKLYYDKLKEKTDALPKGIRAHLGGVKYFLDGSPQLRTAWVRTPYLGGNGKDMGTQIHSDEDVIEAFRFAAERHAQIIIHSNGDAAVEQFLRCLEIVAKEYPKSTKLRHTIIHAQLMGVDQLSKAAELGVIVSFFVAHTYHFADTHLRNLGNERGYKVSPTKSALANGVTFTFHQDAPVIEPDMLETVWCAANRITRNGVHLAGEEISVLDALRAVTVNAAYQYFEEDKKGTIEKGKLADFILLDKNPLEVPKETIRDINILATYKRGECIYKKEQ